MDEATSRLFSGIPRSWEHDSHSPECPFIQLHLMCMRVPLVVTFLSSSSINTPHCWHVVKSCISLDSFTIHFFSDQFLVPAAESMSGMSELEELDVLNSGTKLLSTGWLGEASIELILRSSGLSSSATVFSLFRNNKIQMNMQIYLLFQLWSGQQMSIAGDPKSRETR